MSEDEKLLDLVARFSPLGLTLHGRSKTISYYMLAKSARHCVVELGAFRGVGTIALIAGAAAGNQANVWTLDDYVEKKGWIGEPYEPDDEVEFWKHIDECPLEWRKVFKGLIRNEVRIAAKGWNDGCEPVSVLLWDLGMKDRVYDDLEVWMPRVETGGVVCGRDNGQEGLGVKAALEKLASLGWVKDVRSYPGEIWAATKC